MAIEDLEKVRHKTQFSTENQPSPDAKKEGWAKKRALKQLAESLIDGQSLETSRKIAQKLGLSLDDSDFTFEVILTLRQAIKAMDKGDTSAYNAVMDRMIGKPKQELDVTSGGDKIRMPGEVVFKSI